MSMLCFKLNSSYVKVIKCQSDRLIDLILKHEDKTNQLANNSRFKVAIQLRNVISNYLYGNIIQQQT